MSLSTKFLAHRMPKFQLRGSDNLNRTFPHNARRLVERLVAGEGRVRAWREIQCAPVRDSGGRGRRESVRERESTLRRPNFDCDLQKSMLKKLHETYT